MMIIAIAWLYVVFMMSITEQSATAGVLTFLLYGIFPLTIVLYLMGTPQRKRNRQRMLAKKKNNAATPVATTVDSANTQATCARAATETEDASMAPLDMRQ